MRSAGPWQKSLGLCLALVTSGAGAQTLAPEGQPIVTNHYATRSHQGPVFASSRVVALAGTFVAMADGVDGDTQNPASPGVRVPYSYSDVDNELGAGLTFPGGLGKSGISSIPAPPTPEKTIARTCRQATRSTSF